MDRWAQMNRRAVRFWMSVATAQMHAAMTIAGRVSLLMDVSSPAARRRGEREARTMVIEKAEALAEGAQRATLTAMRLGAGLAAHPAAVADAATRIGSAGFEPARKRVRANMRRLSKSKS